MSFSQFDPARALEHWSRYRPTATALINDTTAVTYSTLDADAARVAESLASRPSGERVAILSHSNTELLTLTLGVAKSGRPCVVLNPTLPLEALLTNVADSEARTILCTSHAFADELDRRLGEVRGEDSDQASYESPIWAVLFSSGSTGVPKGIERDSESIAVEAIGWCLELGLSRTTRLYIGRPMFYTGGLLLALSTILIGGTIVIGDYAAADPRAAWSDYQEKSRAHELDWAFFVPDQLREFLKYAQTASVGSITGSRSLLTMGAPITGDEKLAVRSTLGSEVIESWGNSESLGTITEAEDLDRRPHSVGRPFLTDRLIIVDDDGKPLPPGKVGRIAGGKEAGFQAYAGRPIETANAFHDDLILSDDRGYLDKDGYFYVRGRVQDAVIIGDRTIFIPEVEADIRRLAGVVDCGLMALPLGPGQVEMACLLVVDAVDGDKVQGAVVAQLEQETGNVRVSQAAAIPKTASGKIDRLAVARLLRDE